MVVSIQIPEEAEGVLRHAFGDNLSQAALDGMAVEGYRTGKLSRYEVQKLLGFDNRWDTEAWLSAHGATLDYSVADLEADRRALERMLGPVEP